MGRFNTGCSLQTKLELVKSCRAPSLFNFSEGGNVLRLDSLDYTMGRFNTECQLPTKLELAKRSRAPSLFNFRKGENVLRLDRLD